MVNWRNTALTPSVFWTDARAVLPFLLVFVMPSWTLLWIALGVFVVAFVLARRDISIDVAINKVWTAVSGGTLYARPWYVRRRFSKF